MAHHVQFNSVACAGGARKSPNLNRQMTSDTTLNDTIGWDLYHRCRIRMPKIASMKFATHSCPSLLRGPQNNTKTPKRADASIEVHGTFNIVLQHIQHAPYPPLAVLAQ